LFAKQVTDRRPENIILMAESSSIAELLPRTVIFLFTDVDASSQLWPHLGMTIVYARRVLATIACGPAVDDFFSGATSFDDSPMNAVPSTETTPRLLRMTAEPSDKVRLWPET
jgi:hypothetical protein